jgi:hypothetical protein
MTQVILGGEAVAAGVVTRHELRERYRKIYRGVFVPKAAQLSLRDRAIGAWLACHRGGVVAGVVASALHGASWVDPAHPVELAGTACGPQDGLIPRTERVADDEVMRCRGLPVTTPARTAFDIARYLDRAEALARLDALMWAQHFDVADVHALAQRYPRACGRRQLRELLTLVDGGAATPDQSRARLALHDAGLPRPRTQIPVHDGATAVAVLAMGWPDYGVAVEVGAAADAAEACGWTVIRVQPGEHPVDWLARTAAALDRRGCPLDLQRSPRRSAA